MNLKTFVIENNGTIRFDISFNIYAKHFGILILIESGHHNIND